MRPRLLKRPSSCGAPGRGKVPSRAVSDCAPFCCLELDPVALRRTLSNVHRAQALPYISRHRRRAISGTRRVRPSLLGKHAVCVVDDVHAKISCVSTAVALQSSEPAIVHLRVLFHTCPGASTLLRSCLHGMLSFMEARSKPQAWWCNWDAESTTALFQQIRFWRRQRASQR
jgi:hypothetical protein